MLLPKRTVRRFLLQFLFQSFMRCSECPNIETEYLLASALLISVLAIESHLAHARYMYFALLVQLRVGTT